MDTSEKALQMWPGTDKPLTILGVFLGNFQNFRLNQAKFTFALILFYRLHLLPSKVNNRYD